MPITSAFNALKVTNDNALYKFMPTGTHSHAHNSTIIQYSYFNVIIA